MKWYHGSQRCTVCFAREKIGRQAGNMAADAGVDHATLNLFLREPFDISPLEIDAIRYRKIRITKLDMSDLAVLPDSDFAVRFQTVPQFPE
jgi:hypothetical protein